MQTLQEVSAVSLEHAYACGDNEPQFKIFSLKILNYQLLTVRQQGWRSW